MTWLLHNYWIPTLNPSTTTAQPKSLRPLLPILKQYKLAMKTITRDASLKTQYAGPIQSIYRDIGKWIAEARVTANTAPGEAGWDSDNQDAKERWAIDRLCDVMLEKGVLVPLSKK